MSMANFVSVRISAIRRDDREKVASITFETDVKSPSQQSLFVRTVFGASYEILSNGRVYKCVSRAVGVECIFIPDAYLEFSPDFEYVRLAYHGESPGEMLLA